MLGAKRPSHGRFAPKSNSTQNHTYLNSSSRPTIKITFYKAGVLTESLLVNDHMLIIHLKEPSNIYEDSVIQL